MKVSGFPLDLPRLTSIIGRERCFFNQKKVEITSWQRSEIDYVDVPVLETIRLEEGFEKTRFVRIESGSVGLIIF